MPVYLPEPPESLADRQISAPLTEIDAGQVLAQTFEGLKFLHENGIVHGGLYPGNIRIKRSDPWSIKLSDIGLHRYVDLENPKERQLYASHVKAGFHKPMPVLDTWSAGVVGLSLLSPGGLPIRPAHPNYAQSSWITALARRATAFHACERPGPSGKKDAALFLTRVLRFAYKDRLTAEECLQDPWIELWRLPVSYDREDSQDPSDAFSSFSGGAGSLGTSSEAGSMHEEAEAEEEEEEEEVEEEEEEEEGQNEEEEAGEGSDQDTETEEPYTSTLRSKQPQTSRHTSVASRSNPQQRRSATPPDLLNPWDTSTVSRHTSVGPSDSGPKQGSVAPPDSANRGERTQASRHSSAQPSSTFPSNRAFQGSIPSSSSHPTGTTPPDSTGSGDVGATQGGLRQIRRRGQGRGEGTIPAWQEGDKHLFGHFQA